MLMYDTVARFYDAVHADEHEDIAFILEVARSQAGAVLDLGCGTGRVTLPLAQAGFMVVGVDNSAEMLTLANKKVEAANLQEKVGLISADITNFSLDHPPFALALISQNTLMHFAESQLPALLQSIYPHLAPDGLLLIDLANPLQLA
ncbi:MAG TPA: class I SAM-dependent methyltransferase, partial [Anaerolineae bacterium]|nr:class I SAM-dependent methyltransferase [Anaerolineae bacterium]